MKTHSILLGSLGLAVILGFFGQHIAQSLSFLSMYHIRLVLTALTLLSIALFIFAPYYAIKARAQLKSVGVTLYIVLAIFLCIGTSFWSIFVLSIWWA